MNKILSICCALCLLAPLSAFAQEMTEEEAQAELMALQEQLAEAEARIAELEAELGSLRDEVSQMETKAADHKAKLAELKEKWMICQYGRYKVVEGDWLSKIAGMRNVYHDGAKWPMIYEANKDKIKDPNLIYPDWILYIPTLDEYTVIPGDYLGLIASYLSIYSNAKRWPEIYEANKDKIKDPDWIYPNQVFVIPHD